MAKITWTPQTQEDKVETLNGGNGEKRSQRTKLRSPCGSFFFSQGFKDLYKHRSLKFVSSAQSALPRSRFMHPTTYLMSQTWCAGNPTPSLFPNLAPTMVFLISSDGGSSFQFLNPKGLKSPLPLQDNPTGKWPLCPMSFVLHKGHWLLTSIMVICEKSYSTLVGSLRVWSASFHFYILQAPPQVLCTFQIINKIINNTIQSKNQNHKEYEKSIGNMVSILEISYLKGIPICIKAKKSKHSYFKNKIAL